MRFFILIFGVSALLAQSCQSGPKELKTPAGFPYTLHKDEPGDPAPDGDFVSFHIQQRNGDKVMFSSRDNNDEQKVQIGASAKPNPVEDVLKVLSVGDSATVSIALDTIENLPPDLNGVPVVFFDIVVTGIQSKADFDAEQEAAMAEAKAKAEVYKAREEEVANQVQETLKQYKANKLGSELKTTPEGLKYVIFEQGSGAQPQAGQTVEVAYYGTLLDGTMFDNSFSRGAPFTFPIGAGRVIPGWDMGIPLLNEGGKGVLFIPAELGYGEAGSPPVIPANSELVFYVELIGIK